MGNIIAYCFLYPIKAGLLRRGKRNFIYIHWATKTSSSSYVCTQSYMLIIGTASFSEKVISCLVLAGWTTPSSRKLIYILKRVPCSPEPYSMASIREHFTNRSFQKDDLHGKVHHQEYFCYRKNSREAVKSRTKAWEERVFPSWPKISPRSLEPQFISVKKSTLSISSYKRHKGGNISYLDHWNCLVQLSQWIHDDRRLVQPLLGLQS